MSLGVPSEAAARLLPANGTQAKIRFIPAANANGTASILYRAWDRTIGTAGGVSNLVGTNKTGGTTAFSSLIATSTITVTAVNDAPVLTTTLGPALSTILEDASSPSGNTVASLTDANVTDVDASALRGIAIVGTSGIAGTWQYTLNGGTTWMSLGVPSEAAARLLPASSTQAKIRFIPAANANGTASIHYRAWDPNHRYRWRCFQFGWHRQNRWRDRIQ